MRPFIYFEPQSLEEACDLLARHGDEAKIIAGGQSLIHLLKQRLIAPAFLINIKSLPGLAYIRNGSGRVSIGALTIHHDIETSPLVKEEFPLVIDAERRLGHLQIRNWGTVGGNLCHADPAGDLAPALIALGAKVKVKSTRGGRELALEDFVVDLFATVLEQDEILTEIEVPVLSPETGTAYRKESVIAGGAAIASVATVIGMDSRRKTVRDARIVMGGVGATPLRAKAAERLLVGKKLDDRLLEEAGIAVAQEADPTTSVDGSAEYKREIVRVLAEEIIGRAVARAQGANDNVK